MHEVSPAALGGDAPAHLVGVTGPPGAGKSSLLSALLGVWRRDGRSVAVLAVDPSSKRSGGSLLGDRARIEHDPADDKVLIRSTAAGGRLGGLAPATREAAMALAAAFDVVVVETVGVGQSETDVEEVCDTVAVVVQPASGDVLQFLKAGIMEVPDVLVVTKADLGDAAHGPGATSSQALAGAGLARRARAWRCPRCRRRAASTSWPARSTTTATHRARLDVPAWPPSRVDREARRLRGWADAASSPPDRPVARAGAIWSPSWSDGRPAERERVLGQPGREAWPA